MQTEHFTPIVREPLWMPSMAGMAGLAKRRGGGGPPPLSFVGQTNWARPAFSPVRTVNFTTKAQLDAAIANMQDGDLIRYTGTGVLNISSSGGDAYTLTGKNPVGRVMIDFGTSQSLWNPGLVSGNYVSFNYTGSTSNNAFVLNACSNLYLMGGDISSGGQGILMQGANHDIEWDDVYLHNIGGTGCHMRGITGSGTSVEVHHMVFRGEVNRCCMNPSLDPHTDRGTGIHGFLFHDTNGGFVHDNTIALYAHDFLAPGEVSVGQTWPEGGGGSAIEIGSPSVSENNNTFFIKGENLLMIPNGTNPGSTSSQTGGNVFNMWGTVPVNGMIVGWAEGINCTGAVVYGVGGGWHPGSPPMTVLHGRHSNTNQNQSAGGHISTPYDPNWGIVYQDCT
jgi:hypothetical protein